MTSSLSRLLTPAAVFVVLVIPPAVAQQPPSPDKQAEVLLTGARTAYDAGDLSSAKRQYQELVQKFGNTRSAPAARYGLGLCELGGPDPDFAKAADLLNGPARDGGFAERGPALRTLAACHRMLGIRELTKPGGDLNKPSPVADQRFQQAAQAFREARDWFQGKGDAEAAGQARCDAAEADLRCGRVRDARHTCEPFGKDPAFAALKARPRGLYLYGLASVLDRDPAAAGRALNRLAPFTDPSFGLHAEYLVGRLAHLGGEPAEASVHYDAVLTRYETVKADAVAALGRPHQGPPDPFERARLTALANGPPPDPIAGAAFYTACLAYENGRVADALAKFRALVASHPTTGFQPDAFLRVGVCLVRLGQFDEAVRVLTPLPASTPRLADQAMLWLGKSQLGLAPPAGPDREAKLKAAAETLRQAADRAAQLQGSDPDAKVRRGEILFEYADALLTTDRGREAAGVFEQLWHEQALPGRRDEVLQRSAAARGSVGERDASNHWCDEFRRRYPQSPLTAAVLFQQAGNAFDRAVEAAKQKSGEVRQRYEEAAGRFRDVADKFPEFDRANHARYGVAVCQIQLGRFEDAARALEAIPPPARRGGLAAVPALLADCLARQVPTTRTDPSAADRARQTLTAAADLLDGVVAADPVPADAPAALLALGTDRRRLADLAVDPAGRSREVGLARAAFDKLIRDYPQSPAADRGRLELAAVKAFDGDPDGAAAELRRFVGGGDLHASPVAPLASVRLAVLLRERRQPAEAAKVLDDARKQFDGDLARDPARADWRHLLKYQQAVAVFEDGRPADARPLFDQVYHEARDKPIAAEAAGWQLRCRLVASAAKYDEARKARAQAGADNGKRAAADQRMLHERIEVLQAAEEAMNRAEGLRAALPTDDARARLCYAAAWSYRGLAADEVEATRAMLQGQVLQGQARAPVPRNKVPMQRAEERAFGAYKKLIGEFADTVLAVDARFESAALRADRGDHDEAIGLLRDALAAEPADQPTSPEVAERIRFRLGACLAAKGDYPAAATEFEAVAGNDASPSAALARYRCGECRLLSGEFVKAAATLAPFRDKPEWQTRAGLSDLALLRLGQSLTGAEKFDAARQAFDDLLRRFGPDGPCAADARYGLAWVLQGQGRYDEAIAAYQPVLTAAGGVAAKAQLQVGRCRLAQRKYADAAAAYLIVPVTSADPEVTNAAILEAAFALAADGKPADAGRLLRKLADTAPSDGLWAAAARERLAALKK